LINFSVSEALQSNDVFAPIAYVILCRTVAFSPDEYAAAGAPTAYSRWGDIRKEVSTMTHDDAVWALLSAQMEILLYLKNTVRKWMFYRNGSADEWLTTTSTWL
jgi:hypothetical protein